ncbi:MAG TPA: PKD domain-containing protein [Bacteroidetes bacterium]|nr:PKD domain-containing protein [Bacteroidota bacterium]
MKQIKFVTSVLALLLTVSFFSCTKDPQPEPITGEALFTYDIKGLTVTLTNKSTVSGTTTNAWDFGDGESSTEKNPVHTYARKGDYTIKLVVTDSQNGTHDISTKITVDKDSPVELADNSFDDWSSIAEGFTIGDDAGSIKSFKYDFDSDFIYFYIKQEKDVTEASIFDMLIDLDPDQTTGYLYGLWTKFGGAELLIENSFSNNKDNEDIYWLDFATYDPNGSDWDTYWVYDEGNTADTQVDGTYKVTGNTVEIEFALSRNNIPALKGIEMIKIVAWTSNQDWDEIGWMPDKASTDMPERDGIVIDMR